MTLSPRNEELPQQRTMVGTHHCQPLLCNKEVTAIICYKKTFPRPAFHIFQRSVWQRHTSSLRPQFALLVLSPKSDWCFLLLTHMVSKHKISQTYSSCVFIQLYFHACLVSASHRHLITPVPCHCVGSCSPFLT